MNTTRNLQQAFEALIVGLMSEVESRIGGQKQQPKGSTKGYKRDMACRAPRCRQRSKGPRFHFLCPKHLKGN